MKQQVVNEKGAKALGPYSAGVELSDLVFLSGQLGMDADGNLADDVVAQTKKSLENVEGLLNAIGLTMNDVVKTTVFVADMNDFGKVNEEYGKHFDGIYPARSCVEVSRLPKDAKVEIECIASKSANK